MTYEQIAKMVESIGLPFAYYEFPDNTEKPPPFICFYFPDSDDFYADNQNYVGINRLNVELYTDDKRPDLERGVQDALKKAGLSYSRSERYISSERMYQIVFETEVIINA